MDKYGGRADSSQLGGWIRAPMTQTKSARDDIRVDVAGIYVIYSKVTFSCSSRHLDRSNNTSVYEHKIGAVDGTGGR